MKKRIYCFVLVISMLLPLFSFTVNAASYTYSFGIKTGDVTNGGTDDAVYAGFAFYGGSTIRHQVDSSANDHNRNDYRWYSFTKDTPDPWMIERIFVEMTGRDDWYCEYIDLCLPYINGKLNGTAAGRISFNTWTENKGKVYRDCSSLTQRKITNIGGIDGWGGTYYLHSGSKAITQFTWNRMITDQYGTYNAMLYDDPPTMTYSLSNNAVGTSWLTFHEPTTTQNASISIDQEKLYKAMGNVSNGSHQGIGSLTLTVRLGFPKRSTGTSSAGMKSFSIGSSEYYGKEITFTFYRSVFQLGNQSISQTTTFSPRTNFHYLNRKYTDVTITLSPISIHCDSITSSQKEALVEKFQSTAALYLGNSTSTKLCNMEMTKSGGTLTFKGQVPLDISGDLNDGVRLQLDNVLSSYNERTYQLESGSASQSFYFSTHKVDTKAPTVRLTDVNGTGISIQNSIKKEHNFYLVSSETLYPYADEKHTESNQRYARYELYRKDGDTYGSAPVNITGYLGSGSQTQVQVPVNTSVLTDAMIRLMPASPAEGQYKLRIYGWDDANNGLNGEDYYEIEDIYLDKQAPRVSVAETIQNQAADGTKRNDYTFTITDLQASREFDSWARVYYCFVKDGEEVPDPAQQSIEAATGEMESVLGKWAFVEGGTDTTTAIIKINRGENFEGKLYYYTLDAAGNDSRTEQSGNYFAKAVKIYNYDSKDTLVTESYTYPKSSYDISFDVSDTNYRTEYRWISSDVSSSFRQDYRIYEPGMNVGSGQQIGNDGKTYVFDGAYTLEYKVTELRSGNWRKYEREYVFDNKGPAITATWLTNSSLLLQNQQLKLNITDVSGVASAAYRIVNPDGSPIDGQGQTPINITVTGDNRGTVNDTLTFSLPQNGVYSLEIYATDVNGLESVTRDLTFGIRNEKPQIIELKDNLEIRVDGHGATSVGNYVLKVTLTDALQNVASLQNEQDVMYALSVNGTDFGGWTMANQVDKTIGTSSITYAFDMNTPLALAEGLNTIHIKVACVNKGSTDVPSAALVSETHMVSILLDTQPPVFELPSYHTIQWTNENVTAVIKAADVGTGVCTLTGNDENVEVSEYKDGQFVVTIKDNVTCDLVLADSLGNRTLVPISVSNIDRDAPMVSAIGETWQSGARTDGKVQITLRDKTDCTANFALVKNPTAGYTLTEADYQAFADTFTIKVEKGEVQIDSEGMKIQTYDIYLRGFDGTYAIGIQATDVVGNTTETLFADETVALQDAEPVIVNMTCEPMITKTTTVVTLTFNVPLVVLPNMQINLLSLTDKEQANLLSPAMLETAENYSMEYRIVCSNANPVDLYVKDECGRTTILTFTPNATFLEGFDISAHIERNGEIIQNGGFIAFAEGDVIAYVVNPSEKYPAQYFYIDDAEYSGMKLNEEFSIVVEESPIEGKTAYAKLYFEALHDGKTTKSVHFHSYTLEGNEEDRLEEEYLSISVVDETPPTGSVQYSNINPTNQNVYATVTMVDNESGIATCEKSYDDGITFEIVEATTKYTEEFTENGTVLFRLTNGAGMTSIIPVTVNNIDKTEITEGVHYTVSYAYENYLGEWLPVTQGKAYRRVMATVTPIDGTKSITVTNNSGYVSKILTSQENAFTFHLRDEAGNTAEVRVEYSLFDNQPGTTTYVLSTTEKTNQNIFAFITITDDSGEIAFAKVEKDGVVYPFKEGPLENEYVVELDSSGTYLVTAYDLAGNSWTTTITVSNIDKTPPVVLSKLYSTPLGTITSKSVRVELTEFSKDISTIKMTRVEIVSGLTEQDIIYTPGDKAIRFKKNGSVAMKFVDEYGNEGVDIVTVSNICTNPPAVSAKAVLAEDLLSVNVTFEKMLDADGIPVDPYRELSDLNVTYAGITYKLEGASFTLKNNGDYEFYVHDSSGATQKILLNVTGIDDRAPVVKEVRWEYKYREENQNGVWEEKKVGRNLVIGQDTSGKESGYIIAADEHNPETNQNVNVTVITDKETAFVGGKDAFALQKTVEYRENGLFNFNLLAKNRTSATYGVDVQVIDKTPPVITLANGPELIFIEGMTPQKDPMYAYDKAKLLDFSAYDMKNGEKIDLTDKVHINFETAGRVFDPDNMENNEFNRSNPYYVEYTVYDEAGNGTTVRRTIRLVGFYDTVALINGKMPDSTNVATVNGNNIQISLKNFSGISYARYEKGIFTQGQMKTRGTSLKEKNGVYTIENATEGWYTVYIQTDKRDYFNILVYVVPQAEKN